MDDTLTEREREVIRLRFGFVSDRVWTLQEIGKHYHIIQERVRQIEEKALSKLLNKLNETKGRQWLGGEL